MKIPSSAIRMGLITAALAAGTLLSPALPAQATGIPQCTPDNCDTLTIYYSDATRTTIVGEFEDGPCGQIATGIQTNYLRTYRQIC